MREKILNIVPAPEARVSPGATTNASSTAGLFSHFGRKRLRMILLVVLPLVAVVIGLGLYLSGGRYISTDNAYVGAQKVLITPDISGKITRVAIREGQHVNPGDELFTLDREPFALTLQQAKAKLDSARTDFDKLKTNLKSLKTLAELAQKNVELKQHDVDRKNKLVSSQTGSQADLDTAQAAAVTAQLQAEYAVQQRDTTLNQLLGNPDLPLEQFPEYAQAKAAVENAQRDFDHTIVRAPMSGTATQFDNIQHGRSVAAGTAVLSFIDDQAPWVDANPKATDITYLRVGQKAKLDVDSFPDHTFYTARLWPSVRAGWRSCRRTHKKQNDCALCVNGS